MDRLECDLVMKGGITSGVIYPRLVAKLSSTYDFRCIGGTSAGAIAAAATAAAQLGTRNGNAGAFEELAKLPTDLGQPVEGSGNSMLLTLFQPQAGLKGCFSIVLAMINAKSKLAALAKAYLSAAINFPLAALLGAVPGAILCWYSWGPGRWLSVLLVILGIGLGGVLGALRALGRELPRNQFGLCNGMGASPGLEQRALTPWLHGYLNRLAGKASGEPLTFGELWAGTLRPEGGKLATEPGAERVIELAMMTTALNLGRPFRLPFEAREIYFVEEEIAPFFPESVVRWLATHARPSPTAQGLSESSGKTYLALPEAGELPVLLAVRLSLSFPILLSALPLYAVDRSLKLNSEKPRQATRIYFSDGGICSNFPVHFFDNPLPTRPTFGVNLRGFHPDHPGERVWLPELLRNNQGLKNYHPPLSDAPGLGSVIAFLATIVNTMQDWRDRLQLAMPGFRDRIVHISHSEDEGGLNLNMPAGTIETLAESGRQAAEALLAAFAEGGKPGSANAWENHLRIRARSFGSLVHEQLKAIRRSLTRKHNPSFDEVLLDPAPPSYKFENPNAPQAAVDLLHSFKKLAEGLEVAGVELGEGAPRPSPELRVSPRF
jgi:predicted acylesterase/phospholipase RssA